MKAIMFIILALASIGLVSANPICDYVTQEQGVSEDMWVPGFIPYKNERFLIQSQNQTVGHAVIEAGQITSIGCEGIEEQTYTVTISDVQTVQDLFESESPADTFDQKISSKDLQIKGATFDKQVKSFFTNAVIKVVSWFS